MSYSMIQRVLVHFRFPLVSCAGLVLFLGVFMGALLWVFRKGSEDFYASMERLPLLETRAEPGTTEGRLGHVKQQF